MYVYYNKVNLYNTYSSRSMILIMSNLVIYIYGKYNKTFIP